MAAGDAGELRFLCIHLPVEFGRGGAQGAAFGHEQGNACALARQGIQHGAFGHLASDDYVLQGIRSDVPPFLYPLKRRVPVFYGLGLVG